MHPDGTTRTPRRVILQHPELGLRPGRRLAFAGRVSDEDEEDKSYGLEIQADDVIKFGAAEDWDVILDPAWSGYESGRIPLHLRHIYQRILAAARAGEFDAVCFGRVNRIARKHYYGSQAVEELEATGALVLTADLKVDTREPAGQYVRNIMLATAEFDASSILKLTAAGRDKRLRPSNGGKGKPWLSGRHYGYRYQVPNPLEKIPGAMLKHDGEAAIIIRIFERRADRVSCERIAKELTAAGVPSPMGHKVWSSATVYYILNNPAYLGTGKWGRRVNRRSSSGKRSSVTRREGPPSADMDYPQIVSQELWDRARAATHCVAPSHARKGSYLLNRGMLTCAEHGHTMCGTLSGNDRPRYQCRQHLTERCPDPRTHSVPGDTLEDALWAELLAFLADPERGRQGVAAMIAERDRAVAAIEAHMDGLRKREAQLQARADTALDLALVGKLARERLEAKLADMEQELEAIRAEIRRAEARLSLARVDIPSNEAVAEVCRRLSKGAYYADAAGKRELLEELQIKVWVRGEEWWADGIVPGLHLEGTIQRSQWVQDANAPRCVSPLHSHMFRLSGRISRLPRAS